ncbi:hypothetical protein GSI_03865 [Ganoderma sinense ZZ0214-1]|uniref:Uncharacterized protein n=1 Tax=Ganoderma sinense ZZ0214-1 TaxID=1077348 RepID=A0A2G8SK57_9APHY|nr:hypothetical protein GSI_03865 [Ganoderma sinense ZZ0214-1]
MRPANRSAASNACPVLTGHPSAGGVGGGVGSVRQYAASTFFVHSRSPHFGPTGAASSGSSTSSLTPVSAQFRAKPSSSAPPRPPARGATALPRSRSRSGTP